MFAVARFGRVATSLLARSPRKVTSVRHGHAWTYRPMSLKEYTSYKNAKRDGRIADAVGTFLWFWILYHFYYEKEHLTGEFPYPDPKKWTDAELGIPPDDE